MCKVSDFGLSRELETDSSGGTYTTRVTKYSNSQLSPVFILGISPGGIFPGNVESPPSKREREGEGKGGEGKGLPGNSLAPPRGRGV